MQRRSAERGLRPTLTVLADLLYRNLANCLKGFEQAGPSRLFWKIVDTLGTIEMTAKGIIIRLNKRAHNPLLKEAGLMRPTRAVPWLGGRSVEPGVSVTAPDRDPMQPNPPTGPHARECQDN